MAKVIHSEWVKKQKAKLLAIGKEAPAVVFEKIGERTPVLTKQLENSWTPNLNAPLAINNNSINVRSVLNALKLGDSFFSMNKQPYGPRIEYEGHSSVKAPNGMMRITLAEWQPIVNGVIRGG